MTAVGDDHDDLHAERRGHGPRVVLVHGFTQSHRSWAEIADLLVGDHEVVLPDLPGHGPSPLPSAAGDATGLERAGAALGRAGGSATYVGYSLGGRCCLHLALSSPELVDRLVVVGAHPGIEDEEERHRRWATDAALADRIEAGGDGGLAAFLDEWLSGPLFAGLGESEADRPSRLVNTAAGLASSLRATGTGSQLPLWERLGQLQMPVLVVAGELDDKFLAIAERTSEAIGPNARVIVVAGAGHAAPFEQPDAFAALVRDFVAGD